jgi:hypothetical protein
MDPSLQHLIDRLDQLSEQFRELRKGVLCAIHIADEDPEMALIRTRKVLEYLVRDVFVRRVQEPPGTRPLEALIQRLVKERHFPARLEAYADTIRKLGNVGAHHFGERISAADVFHSLTQLMPILEWYFEDERPEAGVRLDLSHDHGRATPLGESKEGVRQTTAHVAVVPKGLRSFDANDSRFFLQLLPGPRDEYGLPESIRFWKHRIESHDELTFTVGVIYGPSGCGKSSLIKAGLLPRLSRDIIPVYIEATADETETSLLNGLRRRIPHLATDLDLTSTIAAICQVPGSAPGRKVVIVLDQFEQWLHAHRMKQGTGLARALRQCNGQHIQCIVMLRDDFWVALTRFMGDLSIDLIQGQNAVLVDVFDPSHARKVLIELGRSYGQLPGPAEGPSREQATFLDSALQELSHEGRVVPIRLALFAEMVKDKPWTPPTLKQVGGAEGLGVAFLEKSFNSAALRPHQKSAQAVLKALLPKAGTDIKDRMLSYDEVADAAGFVGQPKPFDDLLRTLDREVRLITPTDPEGQGVCGDGGRIDHRGEFYQLTHDFLVPSLREWLTRKQKETRRGRAELRLAERAALWSARTENRHLPSAFEWASIRLLTGEKDWTGPQRRMMRRAGRLHGVRGLTLAAVLMLLVWGVYDVNGRLKAQALRDKLLASRTLDVPGIVVELSPYRGWIDAQLRRAHVEAEEAGNSQKQLNSALALLPVDDKYLSYLEERMLRADAQDIPVLRQSLAGHKDTLAAKCWLVLERPTQANTAKALPAASALALYDPANRR